MYREHPEETPQRLEQLGAGTGAADIEYEQFLKAKEAPPQGAGTLQRFDLWKMIDCPIEKWLLVDNQGSWRIIYGEKPRRRSGP